MTTPSQEKKEDDAINLEDIPENDDALQTFARSVRDCKVHQCYEEDLPPNYHEFVKDEAYAAIETGITLFNAYGYHLLEEVVPAFQIIQNYLGKLDGAHYDTMTGLKNYVKDQLKDES